MNNNEQNAHDPLLEQVLVSFDLAAEHHVAHCEPCQAEREKLEEALRQFGAANREYAMRSERFWQKQALRIGAARRRSETTSRMKMTLVPAVVILLLAAFGILERSPKSPPLAVVQPVVQEDPDHELLLEVERTIQADTPRALEPVTLTVDERESNVPFGTTSNRKEIHSHEN